MAPSRFLVDLSSDEHGDRIALVRDGQVSYLPAARVDIGHTHEGASGSCRYIRRASNGDLYVTGPSLRRTMFRSTDEQCSGELTLLADGSTVVMTYDYRYPDRFAWSGVRGRVSYDAGLTWEPEEYVLGEGENYPGCIATDDGGMITVCPYRNRGPIQAVHWRPRPQNGSE